MFLQAVGEGFYRPRVWPSSIELMVHLDHRHPPDHEETLRLHPEWLADLPVPALPGSYGDL